MSRERWIRRYRRFSSNLLILGPPGSGKSTLARELHRVGPFEHVNAAVLGDLIAAELFGTRVGAFTNAVDRPGRLAAADGGTLFLDEAGELTREHQAHLLTWLDTGAYERLGDRQVRHSSARLILATWRDPAEWMRPDLRDRLGYHVITLAAPTREELCAAIDDALARWPRTHDAARIRLDDAARDALLSTPGASFRSVLGRLEVAWMDAVDDGSLAVAARHLPPDLAVDDPRARADRAWVDAVMAGHRSVAEAAKGAGVGRSTMYRKVARSRKA